MKPWSQHWDPTPKVQTTKVIIRKTEPLDDAAITRAFKGNNGTQWWIALTQLIDDTRADYALGAANAAARNNALDMARLNGAQQAMVELLDDLEDRVKGD
jgi:hypothetical protein